MVDLQAAANSLVIGGVGFTQYATAAYTNDVLDDFCYYTVDYANDKYGGFAKAPATLDVAKDIATESTLYSAEQYESFPTLLEDHFGGSQRASVMAAASGIGAAIATGHSQIGLAGWYLSMLLHKEAWGRLGFFGYDLQDQCGPTNVFSYQSDEGNPTELRGANYPNYAMNESNSRGRHGGREHATSGPIRPIVSRITIHWPSFYNVVTGKTLALPNLIALQHIPLSPAGVIAKRPAPIALPNSCAA